MSWALKRRLAIIGVLLLLFTVFIIVPYFISNYEAPSCVDRKQNQQEVGVDCGGPCTLLCLGQGQDLKIIWTKVFSVRSGAYDIVSYVENPNINIAAKRVPYVVRLLDNDGNELAVRKGATFAGPNERFAVFEGGLVTGDKVPTKGEIVFDKDIAWRKVSIQPPELSIEDKSLTSPKQRPRLSALLKNEGESDVRDVGITAIIYNSDGDPIGASATKVEKVSHNDSAKIFFTWDKGFTYEAATESCESPVDVVLALDRSGSMSSDGKNPPQPLTQAIRAAAEFVDRMSSRDQVGYVSFATTASSPMEETLTDNFERVKKSILSTIIRSDGIQYTNIGDALAKVNDEFQTQRHDDSARPVAVLLTDGIPSYPKDATNPKYAEEYAQSLAETLKRNGVTTYTIGLGEEVNKAYLDSLASSPDNSFIAATGAELSDIYQQIATAICQKGPSVIEIIPRINNVPESI